MHYKTYIDGSSIKFAPPPFHSVLGWRGGGESLSSPCIPYIISFIPESDPVSVPWLDISWIAKNQRYVTTRIFFRWKLVCLHKARNLKYTTPPALHTVFYYVVF